MKTIKTIRSRVAMMVVIFAVAATSCQKENNITPNPGNGVVTPPPANIPVTPPAPAVPQPRFISTTVNGTTIKLETYEYDAQGKLKSYVSKNETSLDSVIIQPDRTLIISNRNSGSRQLTALSLNADKTFKQMDLLSSVTGGNIIDQAFFKNTQFRIDSVVQSVNNPASLKIGYIGNKLNSIELGAQKINVNYFENLPYQKGINEIPVKFLPIRYLKVLEQGGISSTSLYNKLICQVIINNGNSRFELHDYVYEFDAQSRVTKITDTITFTTASTSTQKVAISVISY